MHTSCIGANLKFLISKLLQCSIYVNHIHMKIFIYVSHEGGKNPLSMFRSCGTSSKQVVILRWNPVHAYHRIQSNETERFAIK